jgi:hypothetical protein
LFKRIGISRFIDRGTIPVRIELGFTRAGPILIRLELSSGIPSIGQARPKGQTTTVRIGLHPSDSSSFHNHGCPNFQEEKSMFDRSVDEWMRKR